MYVKLFNITEIAAVLEGIPLRLRADVWFSNFRREDFTFYPSEGFMGF